MKQGQRLVAVVLFLALGGVAQAEPGHATDYANLTRMDDIGLEHAGSGSWAPDVRRVEQPTIDDDHLPELDLPLELELTLPARPLERPDDRLHMGLPDLPPESLVLSWRVVPELTLYVTADLDRDRGLPRLDALDGDTYFTAGAELHLTRSLSVFVEDFQPASGVVGGRALVDEPVPDFSWDGHQIAVGPRLQGEAWTLEAAAVFSVLSPTGRAASVGAMASISLRF